MKIEIKENEYWYGPCVSEGVRYPYDAHTSVTIDVEGADCGNAVNPLLLSSLGRYIWCETGFRAVFENGSIEISSTEGKIEYREGFDNLRSAFADARKNFFPACGRMPPEEFFARPHFNDWIEIMYDQTQEKILKYAHGIIDNGFRPGVLMIDDMWAISYGRWIFDPLKFPDPKGMVDELHRLGFRVILWVCPYVSPDSEVYRTLNRKGGLVRDASTGLPAIKQWWNGFSAVLDMTNPTDIGFMREALDRLRSEYGVDGFKFDGGSAGYYRGVKGYKDTSALMQSAAWASFGADYEYNEVRSGYMTTDKAGVWRLSDKNHVWGAGGLAEVIPNTLAQGQLGYCFSCPDMVGGGVWLDFLPGAKAFDPELFVRYCAASTLLPMIQFSAAPWRVLDKEHFGYIKSLMSQREEYLPVILALAKEAAKSGEPIVRRMEYVFPHEGLERVNDQFMLGDDILVAPCLEKGRTEREVALPKGRWRTEDEKEYDGGRRITIPAPFDRVPVLLKI